FVIGTFDEDVVVHFDDRAIVVVFFDDACALSRLEELTTSFAPHLRIVSELDPLPLVLNDGADLLTQLLRIDRFFLSRLIGFGRRRLPGLLFLGCIGLGLGGLLLARLCGLLGRLLNTFLLLAV